jgi:hypothetical protein
MKAHVNGSQVGSTQTGLGAWVGALNSQLCSVGAASNIPQRVVDGRVAHCAILGTALTQPQIADLAVVG